MDMHVYSHFEIHFLILVAIATFYSESLRILFGQSSFSIVLLRYLHIHLRFFFYFCS